MANPHIKLATSDPPPRSPERAALADIITRPNVVVREIEAAQAAHAKAREHRYDAQCALEKARADADAATDIDSFIEAVSSGDIAEQLKAAAGPSDSIERLEHDVERWQMTEAACSARVTELERDERYFPIYAQGKIDEVIRAEVDVEALLEGFEPLWAEVNKRLSVLTYLHGGRRLKDADMKRVFAAIRYQLETDHAAVDVWRKAIETLQNDADAELPQ
jgi:hypothetical protein